MGTLAGGLLRPHPIFAESEKKVKSALWGFELKVKKFWIGKFFVCDRDFFHFFWVE